jgi:biopolymer transport protein ExbD
MTRPARPGGFERARPPAAPLAEINVTPLVDVMLVLLVIFIITAPLLTYALKVDLPEVKAAPVDADAPTEPVRLVIDAAGALYLGGQPLADGEARTRFAEFAARRPVPELQLRIDKAARFERVAWAMSLAQESGLARIGFVTEPPAGDTTANPAP